MAASYGGAFIFGRSVWVQMVPLPSEFQYATFFGLNGRFSLFGGQRGRVFPIRGLMFGVDRFSCDGAWANFQTYDDGTGRVLIDTGGNAFPQVVYEHAEPDGGYLYGAGGVLLPYRATFVGLV